jgi:peptidoglycan hydrolase FlgJ
MSFDPRTTGNFTDFAALTRLKAAARMDRKAATGTVARQFETIFTQMMLKSMRSASLGSGITDSEQSKQYRDLADSQLAMSLSTRGKGLGIAKMLERQLLGHETKDASTTPHLNALPQRPAAMQRLESSDATNATAPASMSLADDANTLRRGLHPVWNAAMTAVDSASNGAIGRVRDSLPANATEFVQKMLPHAQAAADKLGVSVRAVLAHAALETGWGRHMPHAANGASSNNLFGIKAGQSWDGARARVATTEYENGVAVRRVDAFRAYASPTASFNDYADLIAGNPRYASALGHGDNVKGFAAALQRGGYATDPAYARKLAHIADSVTMRDAMAALKNPSALPTL